MKINEIEMMEVFCGIAAFDTNRHKLVNTTSDGNVDVVVEHWRLSCCIERNGKRDSDENLSTRKCNFQPQQIRENPSFATEAFPEWNKR